MGNTFWAPSCQPELYHHGIKGQKWGVRRYQPYADGSFGKGGKIIQKAKRIAEKGSARSYTRAMNKLSTVRGESQSKRAEYTDRYNYLVDKQSWAKATGKDKKASRLESKAWKMRAKLEEQNANVEAATKAWQKIGKEAVKNGYSVRLTEQYKYSKKARRDIMISQYVLGLAGNVATTAAVTASDKEFRAKHGTDYSPYAYTRTKAKVKDSKGGSAKTIYTRPGYDPTIKETTVNTIRTDLLIGDRRRRR